MATAIHHPLPDSGPVSHHAVYPGPISIPELNFSDGLYQPIPSTNTLLYSSSPYLQGNQRPNPASDRQTTWLNGQENNQAQQLGDRPELFGVDAGSVPQQRLPSPPFRNSPSLALPPGAAQSMIGRYSFDENLGLVPYSVSDSPPPVLLEPPIDARLDSPRISFPPVALSDTTARQDASPPRSQPPGSPDTRYLSTPIPVQSPRPSSAGTTSTSPTFSPAITPVLAAQTYNQPISVPISPTPRAVPQQPVYVTPNPARAPVNPVYTPARPNPPEEVCIECSMRDQDMADVDVTTPGVWERDSDVVYEELLRREQEEQAAGFMLVDPSRPRAIGGRLTETNLKIWLSINPREPTSRQQTLEKYIKSQRKLLEAEVIAHARAMQEARQLDSRMRDTYSQLRKTAYDLGSSASPIDDQGGVRIKPPRSPAVGTHYRSHSREVTLLENGMIVEHVDVRKEEKEARERKRKEEKRARKLSRSSGVDATSLYSVQSLSATVTDGGVGLRPHTLYSPTSSTRPTSVLTNPMPHIPRALSQASFSDVRSLGSVSPRRSRFFGAKNLSTGWRSQDSFAPSGVSGSMVDMHVALQREARHHHPRQVGATSLRQSQIWPTRELEVIQQEPEEKPKKKTSGFKKIWRIVTGTPKSEIDTSSRTPFRSQPQPEEDFPLAPPPPLSFLVDRTPVELPVTRQNSSPSVNSKSGLPSSPGMSPPTAPSSVLPSPASSSRPGGDRDIMIEGRSMYGPIDREHLDPRMDETWKQSSVRNIYPNILESETRPRVLSSPSLLSNRSGSRTVIPSGPMSVLDREKSLPPLPHEMSMASPGRPVTVFDTRRVPPAEGLLSPPNGYRGPEVRRQSCGGLVSRTQNPHHNVRAQTAFAGMVGYDAGRSLSPLYDEFAFSRRSLGRLEHVEEHPPMARSPTPSGKRKSKFGLASLFGKSNNSAANSAATPDSTQEIGSPGQSTLRLSESYDGSGNYVNGTFTGRPAPASRMSTTSRRVLEELVEQDPEFVAYRYPSGDQRLDLLR